MTAPLACGCVGVSSRDPWPNHEPEDCPNKVPQEPQAQELDPVVRHDTAGAEAAQGRTAERLCSDSAPTAPSRLSAEAQKFVLTRPLTWFDLETTGKDPKTARIVEATVTQFVPDDDGTVVKTWTGRFNPGVPIEPGATEKHGITNEMAKTYPPFSSAAERLLPAFRGSDYGGYNIRFDIEVLGCEYARLGISTERAEDDPPPRIIDGFRLWQIAEPRTLSDFVRRWAGRELAHAHSASADIQGTIDGVIGLLTERPDLPRDLQELHDLQFPRDPDAVDSNGLFRRVNGVIVYAFGKHKGQSVLSQRGFFNWWISQPGRNTREYRKMEEEIFG